jgi:CTP synthase (UTP-ammonia lyase)
MPRIGIIGDFNPEYRSHHATNAALQHAAAHLGCTVEIKWVPTASLVEPYAVEVLASYDGLWASPGSPYRSMQGMLAGIQFARTRNRPFVAT